MGIIQYKNIPVVFTFYRIIEIGAVEIVDGIRTGFLFQSYAKNTASIHPMAFEAHQISEEMLLHQESLETVLKRFLKWVGDSPLVAHNLKFDIRMLSQVRNY